MANTDNLKLLYRQIGKLIISSLTQGQILDAIMQEVQRYFKPENWSLLKYDHITEQLHFLIAKGLDTKKIANVHLKVGEGIAGTVARTGEPIFAEDVSKDARFSQKVDALSGFKTKSILAVPLTFREKVFGVIELINYRNNFTSDDLFILQTIADFAAIALANSQIYEETLTLTMVDPLTGVFNRQKLQQMMQPYEGSFGHKRKTESVLACMIDLNNFKTLNDSKGHAYGDEILKKTATSLTQCVRTEDYVFRLGGDEFLLLFFRITANTADSVRQRVQADLQKLSAELGPVSGLSYGFSFGKIQQLKSVIELADMEMYQHKQICRQSAR